MPDLAVFPMAMAPLAGATLGLLFFVGLWWTVRRAAISARPALWLGPGFMLRIAVVAERGLSIAHTTILHWVRLYAPEFDKLWSRFAARTGMPWRVDETYVRIRGQWAYLYRAVDAAGKTVDFRLSPRRNVASAKAFFRKAVRS